jgi:hypothetical protein
MSKTQPPVTQHSFSFSKSSNYIGNAIQNYPFGVIFYRSPKESIVVGIDISLLLLLVEWKINN